MNILRYIAFPKIILDFSFTIFFWLFQLWKLSPPAQGEVRHGSRRSASGGKEKCAGVKEKCIRGQGEVLQVNTTQWAEALLFDPDELFLDPWHIFPWLPTHFSLTPNSLLLDPRRTSPWPGGLIFQSWKKQTICERNIENHFCKRYINNI